MYSDSPGGASDACCTVIPCHYNDIYGSRFMLLELSGQVVRFCSSFDVLKTCLSEMCYECVNGAPLTSVFVLIVLRDTHCVTTAAAAADDDDAFPARLPSGTQDCTV